MDLAMPEMDGVEATRRIVGDNPHAHVLRGRAGGGRGGKRQGRRPVDDARRPDVVVLDVVMPVMDGLKATRNIERALPTWPVVAVSMHGATGSPAKSAGADAFLLKGFSGDDLARVIRGCAGDWRMPWAAGEARDGQ